MANSKTDNKLSAADLLEAVADDQKALNFKGALQHVVAALALYPNNIPLQIRKAVVLRQLERNDESITHLQALLKQHPSNLAIMIVLVASYRVAGNHEASLELIDAILVLKPNHRGALVARIDIAIKMQNFVDALRHVGAAEAVHPNDLPVQVKKGIVFRQLDRHDEGISLLISLLAQNPSDLTIMHILASSHRAAGDLEASLALFDAMLVLQPNHRGALVAKVELAIRLQNFDALSDFAASQLPTLMSNSAQADKSLAAILGAKILAGLPIGRSPHLFDEISEWLVLNNEDIPSILLWRVYERADLTGKGALVEGLLDELFSRKTLGLRETKQILAKAYQLQVPHWKEIGLVLMSKQLPENRPQFELEYRALAVGASSAIRQRSRHSENRRTVAECLVLSSLLKQAGKQRVAVRYLHKVFSYYPDNVLIFKEYVRTSIASGEPHRFAKAIERLQSSTPQGQLAIAMAFIEMNELKEARKVLDGITNPQSKLANRGIYISVLIGLNEIDAAEQVIREMQLTQSPKSYTHFNTSLQGALFADAKLANEASLDQTRFSFIAPAVHVVSGWMNDTAAKSGEKKKTPRKIVQYWDKEIPPSDISEIMQTWKDATLCDYHLFNRATARRFINDQLGGSWSKAFAMCRTATEQSDFFRLCFLMLEGGIYADSDDRLICNIDSLFAQTGGLTATLEPFGTIGNNIVMTPAKHPAIVWAAVSAKLSLLQRDNDSTWTKVGPGLLTRAVARYIQQCDLEGVHADLTIIERYKIGKFVQYHTPLPYKKTQLYWNSQKDAGSLKGLSDKFSGAAN
jgi:mannosyltransferase OCH1-like enzyme/Flp pilus assembly protein TadD